MDSLSWLVPITPIVTRAIAILAYVDIFWIIYVLVGTRLYTVDDAGLEVYEDCSGYVSRIVALVVEDIFPVAAFSCEVFEVTILVDPMLLA